MKDLVVRLMSRLREDRKPVLIIGDTIIDRWVTGRQLPCQDGCPKFVKESVRDTTGGAANAANCLSQWPIRVNLCGMSGDGYIPVKTRCVEDGRILYRVDDDREENRDNHEMYDWVRNYGFELVRTAGAVLLSDYDKGLLTTEFIANISAKCQRYGIPCVADAKRRPEVYKGCIIKSNQAWYEANRGFSWPDVSAGIVTTYGGDSPTINCCVMDGNMPPVNCVNHVGAGDCFAAHLVLCLAYGFSLKEAAALAHSAGRVYVQHPYNRPPAPNEIAADLATAR